MNKCIFIGRLTRPPESKSTQSGKKVVNFSLAINNGKDRDATFVNFQAWEKTAEIIENYCLKGSQVCVTAALQNNNYEKDGQRVYRDIFVVREIELLGSKKDSQDEQTEQNSAKYQQMQEGKKKPSLPEGFGPGTETIQDPTEIDIDEIVTQMPF